MSENESNSTELFDAIIKDDEKTVREICNRNITLKDTINEDYETAVHIATRNGNLNLLTYLLTKDFTLLDCQDRWGQTVMLLAAKKGYVYIVRYLVDELRVDLNSPKYQLGADSPIHVAAEEGQLNVVKWYFEDFQHLKGNRNLRNARGETLAVSAVKGKQHEVLQYILEEGMADPLIVDYQGNNVLFHSAFVGDLLISQYLIDALAINFNVDDKNYAGMTVLFVAARFGHLEMVKYFVGQRNATIDLANNLGWTPLHEAACEGHLDVVKYLVEKKADITRKEMQGRTPLMVAKSRGILNFLRTVRQYRKRRSVSAFFEQSPADPADDSATLNDYNLLPVDNVPADLIISAGRISSQLSPESNSGEALPALSKTVDGWLILANVVVGLLKGASARKRHQALRSPEEMIQERMDPEAVRAVQQLPDSFWR